MKDNGECGKNKIYFQVHFAETGRPVPFLKPEWLAAKDFCLVNVFFVPRFRFSCVDCFVELPQ